MCSVKALLQQGHNACFHSHAAIKQMDELFSAALSELDQFDKMINWMLVTYFGCLALGWGLLLFDWVWNKVHKLHSQVLKYVMSLSLLDRL